MMMALATWVPRSVVLLIMASRAVTAQTNPYAAPVKIDCNSAAMTIDTTFDTSAAVPACMKDVNGNIVVSPRAPRRPHSYHRIPRCHHAWPFFTQPHLRPTHATHADRMAPARATTTTFTRLRQLGLRKS